MTTMEELNLIVLKLPRPRRFLGAVRGRNADVDERLVRLQVEAWRVPATEGT